MTKTLTPQLSLGFSSDFCVSHLQSEITELKDYIALKTPRMPDYYFGNLLALKVPLSSKNRSQWRTEFNNIFSGIRGIEHETYTWLRSDEDLTGIIQEFIDDNFDYEEVHILSMELMDYQRPKKLNTTVKLRSLTSDDDWQQWLKLSIIEHHGTLTTDSSHSYLFDKAKNYRQLDEAGFGQTLGAFINDRLIGYAGLYHLDRLARFQNVHVIAEYENQKVATTLLDQLIHQTNDTVKQLVIVADEHYHATSLYQNLGFRIAERECSLCWWQGKA